MTDQTTASSRWAPPDVVQKLPPLSPPFQSADDAARYAHELIGNSSNPSCGGCIVKNAKGHFFSTLPLKNEKGFFKPWSFLSTDSLGRLKHPDGFTCCAFYLSRGDDYEKAHESYGGSPEEVATRIDFFLSHEIYAMMGISSFACIHYLSGLNGSLIKYQCDESVQTLPLFKKLIIAEETSAEPFPSVVDAVRELADSGALSVLQSTEVWHSKTGPIDSTFSVYSASIVLDIEPVIIQRPAFGPLLFSEKAALNYMLSRIWKTPDSNYGFILRHIGRPEFMVTEPVTGTMDFLLHRAFCADGAADLALPAGYEILAVYGCEGEFRDPQQVPAVQTSLFRNFLNPQSLKNGIDVALRLGFRTGHRSLPLYIATRDGALLKYVSVFSTGEQKLFAQLSQAEGGGMELVRNLLADVESTLSYIRLLANSGELSVIRVSDQWGSIGRIESHWVAYQHIEPLSVSPPFLDADQAARYAHEHIAQRVDAVYGGLVYRDLDGRFIVTLPVAVLTEIFDPKVLLLSGRTSKIPPGSKLVAIYQSQRVRPLQLWRSKVSEQLNRTMIAPHILSEALKKPLGVLMYYFSAYDGTLLKYTVTESPKESLLGAQISPPAKQPQKVKSNSIELRLRANTLTPEVFIYEVASAGMLDVMVPSKLWGPRGKVTDTWRPQPPTEGRGPQVGMIYSQIFSREDDAIRYAHKNMGERNTRQSGFILKSLRGAEFVVTEPVNAKRYTQFGDLLLANEARNDSFAPGFYLCAVYLAAPKFPVNNIKDPLYGNFFSPKDIGLMLSKLHGASTDRFSNAVYPALYLSTRDGALLRYRTSKESQDLERQLFREAGQVLLDDLKANRMSAQGYVRRLAYVGQLEVLITSAQWSVAGPVATNWASGVAISDAPSDDTSAPPPLTNHRDEL